MNKIKIWKRAQMAEMTFWKWINKSFPKSTFYKDMEVKFSDILKLTGIDFKDDQSFLDIGCGPVSVYLALDKGKRIALDPLMDYYLRHFPYLRDFKGVEWVTGKVEEWENKEAFNTVFMLNFLNHCENLEKTIKKVKGFVLQNGYLVITQLCHTQKWTKNFFEKTSFVFDKCHPCQFEKEDVINSFKDNFKLIKETNIDYLDAERIKRTNKSLKKKTIGQKMKGFFTQPDRFDRNIYSLVSFLYRKRLAGKPLISAHLFVFKRIDN